ncbi:MAG: domain S-box protein [Conexibacter sp.]|nr:domain S-box protein [Conexibacter sp.]
MTGIAPRHAQQLFMLSRDLLIVVDDERRIVSVNPSWERVLGYRPEQLAGRVISELLHPGDTDCTAKAIEAIAHEDPSAQVENRYRHADGHWVWLRWTTARDERDGFFYGVARDVSAERKAADEASETLRRMEDAQRVARVGSWEVDLLTGQRFYTREMFAIQGRDPDVDPPWDRDDLLSHVVPEDHQRINDAAARAYAEPGVPVEVEYRMHTPVARVSRTTIEVVIGPDGEPRLIRGTTQDVTELRENERRLAEAEEMARIGSFESRVSDGRLIWSAGTYRLYGMDPDGPPPTREVFYASMLPEEAAVAVAAIRHAVETLGSYEIEYSLPSGDGTSRIRVLGSGEVFRAGDETYIRGTIQDVTRQRLITRQQQEIARLGQLALAGTDLRHLFDEVCRVATDLLGTDMANVLALQGDGSLAFASSRGFGDVSGTAIPAGNDSIVRHALGGDQPLVVADWHAETRFPYSAALRDAGVRCTAVVPIRGRDGPFGVLTTHALEPGVATPEQNVAFLDALAAFLATAIDRLRHEAEIAALATLRGRLVAENLEAEERVRQRISETLHDGALQDLLAARQDLVEAGTASDATSREEMVGYAREGVERAVRLLREAVHALHPVVLQHGGLEAAMQAAAGQAARQGNFRAEVVVDPEATGLRDELVMSLARELLTNCAKHAQAETVRVTVGREDGAVLLEVADDGRGIDPADVAAAPMRGHIGLASLTQRVEAVGGSLELGNAPDGRGTTVLARLPID